MYKFEVEKECIDDLKPYIDALDMSLAIDNAKQIIRTRLKHGDPSDSEEQILDQIREVLCYER